jgi:hypothetical protein
MDRSLGGPDVRNRATRSCLAGRVFDKGDDAAGHEPAAADRPAGSSQLNHLDDSATSRHLDPAPSPGGFDLVGPHPVAGIHDDLDAITLHAVNDPPGRAISPYGAEAATGCPRRGGTRGAIIECVEEATRRDLICFAVHNGPHR